MRGGIEVTLRTLVRSGHSGAVDVLAAAVEGDAPTLWEPGVRALLSRGTPRSRAELVRICDGPRGDEILLPARIRAAFESAVAACLRSGGDDGRHALGVVQRRELLGCLATVVEVAGLPTGLEGEARLTIQHLVDRLADQIEAADADGFDKTTGRNVGRDVGRVLATLAEVTRRSDAASLHGLATRSILLLGNPDRDEVRELLWTASDSVRERVDGHLLEDEHPRIVRLVVDLLDSPRPSPVVARCVRERRDGPFVECLLNRLRTEPSETLAFNLAKVDHVDWLAPEELSALPTELHPGVVRLVRTANVPDPMREAVLDWALVDGSVETRLLAADHLASLPEPSRRTIVVDGLENDDVRVQAWATRQLRASAIPNAIALLLDRLESDTAEIREAARSELTGFDLPLVLEIHSSLSPSSARRAGRLLERIDPHVGTELAAELTHPQFGRRVEALQATAALGLGHLVVDPLLEALGDADPVVRRHAAAGLADANRADVLEPLARACEDGHHRVAETALESVRELMRKTAPAEEILS